MKTSKNLNRLSLGTKQQGGAILVELAGAIIFLIVMYVGVLQLGSAHQNVSWISQNAYDAALSGVMGSTSTASTTTSQTFDSLFPLQTQRVIRGNDEGHGFTTTVDNTSQLLTVTFNGSVNSVSTEAPTSFTVSYTGPVLSVNAALGSLSTFSNPSCSPNCSYQQGNGNGNGCDSCTGDCRRGVCIGDAGAQRGGNGNTGNAGARPTCILQGSVVDPSICSS